MSHPSLDLCPTGTMVSSDFSSDILQDFTSRFIPSVWVVLYHPSNETSPVPSSAFTTSHTPYTGEFFTAVSGSLPLLLPSPCVTGSALSCSPCGANMSALQACPDGSPFAHRVEGYHFMLRAIVSLPFLRDLRQRFDTISHPATSPKGLLSGGLTLTRAGLSPASRR